ncbi:MAG: hypothetical protein FWF59_14785 [Turicibacter sp.]|nr:hypothetical protein [Turicibacter sp.]
MPDKKTVQKIDGLVADLEKKILSRGTDKLPTQGELVALVKMISNEVSYRSKTILTDYYFDWQDEVTAQKKFQSADMENKFYALDLRNDVFKNYTFESPKYPETMNQPSIALKTVGYTAGATCLGSVLVSGLSLAALANPISLIAVVTTSAVATLAEYFVLAPKRQRQSFEDGVNAYLETLGTGLKQWFNSIEDYLNQRVAEIK